MKILVGIKRVVDYNVRVRVLPDGSGVDTDGVKMSINPFDEIALEEALRLKEAGICEEVVVASVGVADAQQQLRTGLAMGADRAILVETDEELQPLGVAKVLRKLIDKEGAGLVILGKQTIDGDNNQTGQMLAALWDRPITFWDERLSTVAAERALLEADTSRKRRAEVIDHVAASYILQGALDRLRHIQAHA